jgi:hypothetical protein
MKKNQMIRLTVLGILFLVETRSFAQTSEDKQTVIQTCIDLAELQQYYHADSVKGRKPLIIYNNGIVPNNLKLTKFGEPVLFMTKEELFFYNNHAYLSFGKFEITPSQVDIQFHYKIEGLTIALRMKKIGDNWIIKTKKITEL